MPRIVPSQVVAAINQLIPHAINPEGRHTLVAGTPDTTFKFQAIIDLAEQIPTELITLQDDDYSVLSASVSALRWHIQHPQETEGYGWTIVLHPIKEFGRTNPLALISDMLSKCPDEFPAASTSELIFIQDQDLRTSLRNDLSSVSRALSNSEWKAATVLAGSVIEALLLWRLGKEEPEEVAKAAEDVLNKNGFYPDITDG